MKISISFHWRGAELFALAFTIGQSGGGVATPAATGGGGSVLLPTPPTAATQASTGSLP